MEVEEPAYTDGSRVEINGHEYDVKSAGEKTVVLVDEHGKELAWTRSALDAKLESGDAEVLEPKAEAAPDVATEGLKAGDVFEDSDGNALTVKRVDGDKVVAVGADGKGHTYEDGTFEQMVESGVLKRETTDLNAAQTGSPEGDGVPAFGVGSVIELEGHEYKLLRVDKEDDTVYLENVEGETELWSYSGICIAFNEGDARLIDNKNYVLTDNQGNPVNENGTLKVEEVKSVDELTDEDFSAPTRNVQLPALPYNVDAAIGANGKPVIIKKNIFEKNWNAHRFPFEESRAILNAALYNTDLVGQTQPNNKPLHWVAIKIDDKSPIVVLEVNENKDNIEIVGWYTLDERNLNRIKRQAEKNGGELVMLSPMDKVESLSTPQTDLSSESKGTEQSSSAQVDVQENAPMPMRVVGKGKNAAQEEDWLATTPKRGHDYVFKESGLDAEEANAFVENKVAEAEKNLEKVKGKAPKMGTNIAAYKEAKADYVARVAEAQKAVDYWNGVKAERDKVLLEERRARKEKDKALYDEAVAQEEQRKAEMAQKAAEQEAVGSNAVAPAIKDKWENARKVDGGADEITLPNGEVVTGHYVLTESGAASASHQATNGFAETEGYPVDVNGETVNDRDYKRDAEAQQVTRGMAADYDSRALQSPVVVSGDGVVLSGNGRTMAGEIAALNGSDAKYNAYLRGHAGKFGFTTEQVEGFKHPRVVFVPDGELPYTSETFAKFNQREQKSQSRTEMAVKLGKVVDDALFGRVMDVIGRHESLAEFYADDAATASVVKELADAGVIPQTEMAQLFDGGRLSESGQAMVEGVLVGKVFQGSPDAVRQITEVKSMRKAVMAALPEVVACHRLGGGYDLSKELAAAVDLVYKARKAGFKLGQHVSQHARQGNLFQLDDGATVADYNNAAVMMLADVMNDGRVTQLKKVLSFYNTQAADSAQGIGDMFAGGVKSKGEIINEVNELLNDGQEYDRSTPSVADGQGVGGEGGEQGDVAGQSHQGGEGSERGLSEAFDGLAAQLKTAEGEERARVLGEMRDGIARFAEENGYPVPEFLLTREDFLAAVPEKDKAKYVEWLDDGAHMPAYYTKGKVYVYVEGCETFDKDVNETLAHEYTHADNAEFPENVNALTYALEDTHEVTRDELCEILREMSQGEHYDREAERLEAEGKDVNKMLADEVIAHVVARMVRDGEQVLDGITKNPTLQFIIKRAYKARENERQYNIRARENAERHDNASEGDNRGGSNNGANVEGESANGGVGRPVNGSEGGEVSSERGRSTVSEGKEVAAPSEEGAKVGVTDGVKSSATGDVMPSGKGESVKRNEVLEYEKALDHLEDVEQKWGDKIQDYVSEHYPTQATTSAESTSEKGLQERKAMKADPVLKQMYAEAKKEIDAADEMVTQKYSALPEDLRQQKAVGKSAQPPTREESILRDVVIEHMKGSGLDVIGTEDGQRVLDMANDDGAKEHRVYHGSGAEFDHFDHSHMGEGEGAQAYGWGTYVTEVRGIGEGYAIRSKNGISMSREEWSLKRSELESNIYRAKEQLPFCRGEYKAELEAQISEWEEQLKDYEPHNYLYTVEIPDDNGGNYLDWNGPVPAETIDRITEYLREKYGDEVVNGRWLSNPLLSSKGVDVSARNGAAIYRQLERTLGSDKKASLALAELGYAGIKYPAEFRSGGRKDGAKNYVIFNENDAEITDHVRFFKTKNGEAYGFTVGGKIYYDPRIANAETPVHEYAHLWASALKANNAKEWKNVVDLMKGTKVWEEVKKTYPELETDDEIADEVLATYSGRRGAERLREEMRKAAAEGDGVMGKAEAVSALQRVKRAIDKFWKAVADFLHIHYTSAEEVADRVMKDLLDGVDPRSMMDGGKSLRPETRVNIVETKSEHGFKNYAEAKTWAKEHIARTYSGEETGGKGDIRISNAAVDKYLSQSAVDKSESKDVHLAVLKVLPDVIRESVDAEQHADFKKGKDGVRSAENGVNPNVTIHRLYGAVRMDGKVYRVKVTLKENTRTKETPKAYSYEATKIELLEGSLSQTEGSHNLEPSNSKSEVSAGQHGNVSGLTSTFPRYSDKSITAAKLLNGVEKSYGGGKFFEDYNKIREQFIGEKGAESFDHADEVSTRLDNLGVAREMEAEKKDAKAIKMATGWERGADGKWRYEVGDVRFYDGLQLINRSVKTEATLDDLLEDNKDKEALFASYPSLKNMPVVLEDMGYKGAGEYNYGKGTIRLNTYLLTDDDGYFTKPAVEILNHEIQHAIQKIEGFARGGSPAMVRSEIKKQMAEVTKQIRQLRAEGKEAEAKELIKKNRGLYEASVGDDDFGSYKSLAGEVESRNVESRMGMSAEERRASLAAETEDVNREDQIFLTSGDGGETAHSVEMVHEPSKEETVLRDVVIEHMKGSGLDVIGTEDGQRVLDMANGDGAKEHRVYHGSGADFDHFDHSHMGEGEGAQAYGWGTYVTEVRGIGESYAKKVGNPNSVIHRVYRYLGNSKSASNALMSPSTHKKTILRLIDKAIATRELILGGTTLEPLIETVKKELKVLKVAKDLLTNEQQRILYTVEIPDDNGKNYLDWNGPVPVETIDRITEYLREKYGDEVVNERWLSNPLLSSKGVEVSARNGAAIYRQLERALGSDKKASLALAELGYAGIKYPADNLRGGRKDGAKNYVIFNENDAEITDHVRFFKTKNGEAYGFTVGGKIYYDPRIANAETPVHEYAHLWASALKANNAKEWKNVVDLMKGTKVWEEVKKTYPELETDDEIADEVLATYSGRRGAERLREEMRKAAAEGDGVMGKAEAVSALQRVKRAIDKFWKAVADFLHIHYTSAEEVADRVMKDLLDGVDPRKFMGDKAQKEKMRYQFMGENGAGENVGDAEDYTAFAKEYGVDADVVKDYALGMKTGNLQKADFALTEIRRTMRVANRGMKLSEFGKLFRPVQKELAERYGDIEKLRQEHIDAEMRERGVMEAARKRAEEEAAKRKARADELRLLPEEELDRRYFEAVERGDDAAAREMLDEAARRKGYDDTESGYQGVGVWVAPSNPGYETDEARRNAVGEDSPNLNVEDMAAGYSNQPEDIFVHPDKYSQGLPTSKESGKAIQTAIDDIRNGKKEVKIKVYRAVPTSVKESKLRNGDWVTPSKEYAELHGNNRLEGKYRIIEDEVPAGELWWDSNDVNEWGFDDGKGYKYKNVENNRKLNDLVTRDDAGEIIAPSKRFDENVEDVRYREGNVKNPAEMSDDEKSSRGNQLLSAPAVNVESNQIVKTEEMSARKAAEKWWREHIGEPLFYDTEVGQVEINENSIGSSLAHRYGQAKLDAITSLKDGFKNAVYLGTMPDFVRQEGVQNHYFAYPIMYNGKRNYVFCRAMQDNNKNRLYVHEVFVADSIQNEGNTLQTAASQPHGGIALYKAILSDVLSAAKVGNNFGTLQLSASEKAKHQAANDLARQMHVEGEVEVVTSTDGLTGRQAKAKGWYDVRTGKVTIVLPNNKNAADVRETVFHEVVAHKGLRNLVGEEHFNTFLDNVYNNAEEGIKQTIDEMAEKKYEGDKRKATEEYMAHLAEDGEYVKPENQGFFAKVRDFLTDLLRKVGIKLGFKLTDNDLRYILWRSWKGLAERDGGSVFEKAEDVKMQHELGQTDEARSASGENGIMFREGSDELKDVVEKMKADVERLHEGELDDLRSGARAIGGRLSELNKAMRLQRAYDMSTVASVTELAKTMLKNGLLSEMSDYDVRRLLSVVNNVHGKGDIRPYVQKVVDMMVGNRLRNVSKAFDKLLAMRGKKVDARGVEVQGELDLAGQRMADVVWKGIGMSDDDVSDMCADAQDRMMSANGAEAAAAATDYAGWQIVMRYNETIRDSKSEEVRLREDLKRAKEDYDAGRMTREAYMEFRESTNDAIRENRIERAEAYEELYEQLGGAYGESIKRAADFKAAEKARVLEIQHNANSDMEGRPARSYRKDTAVDKVLNSSPVQLLFAPLGTFDQMLRMFGSKNVKGEGYLWNRYMRGWLTATENEYTGYRDATAELDAKAAEVLGKGKTWADLFALERKLPKATVRVWDDGEMRELELPQGNLLYIYMVDKMADGRMKLRKMGVTEDDVAAIEDFLDPRLKEIGDWLQEVYLVEKRGKYNEVHERMFGAAMASIDNYFPLKILKDARAENVDVGVEKRESEMASTITGSVVKRTRNALALDLLNSDAFSVVLDHLQQMEHWSAFAEWNRDLNTLLSYKHFRNQVKNMRSAYGSGERLWEAFDKVARIAAGTYTPPKAFADKLAVNIAKGVTAAKISLRVFTALKQFTSFPAYLSDSNPVYLLKGVANPYGSWKWCMENLPLFEKRWKSRMAGDPRLLKNEMDWGLWRDNVVQMAAKWGMTPNGFVDALTVCIGARAMYETRRRKYIRYGYGLEEAERRAKQDASILYNQTQQSSEGAFLSALQVDRSWYSVLFTVFRNSSMSYTRQLYAALRNTGRRIAGGAKFKGISEAFMAKQMERDGIDPEKASKNAKAEYRKSWINDFVRAGVFGYVLQLAWNCGPYALYMMFGDDEKKGKEMWHDIWTHTAFGSVEGLTGGDVWSAGLQSLWNHYVNGEDFNANSVNKDMPLTSDLLNVVKKVGSDNYGAVNDVLNLLVQAGFGVNPQTLTDAAVAIYDYCGSDVETTKECALLVMRVMNCPQSQMDNIYFDEIDATGEEAKAMSVEEIAERYARYKALRSAPLRALSSDALKAAEKKPRERVLTEAKEQLDGRLMTEETQRYLDEYEATKKKVTETRALADTDPKAFMQQMPALARSGEFRRYRRVGLYKSEVNKLTKKLLRTSDPAERRALFGKMLDARDKMLKQVREME